MRTGQAESFRHELFSAEEIALAAGAEVDEVRHLIETGRVVAFRRFVAPAEAIALVRRLSSGTPADASELAPLTVVPPPKRRSGISLAASGVLHGVGAVLLMVATTLGLLTPNDTEEDLNRTPPTRVVYLVSAGPGGGGGGGGLQMATPPPPAMRQAPLPQKKISSPIVRVKHPPPVRSTARLTRPVEPPRVVRRPIDRPRPASPQVVQAPVVPAPADSTDAAGLLDSNAATPSAGIGRDGGVGSGRGTGLGPGDGAGLGDGIGGGTGGGPFRPGSGIEPPSVVREVRPTYTDAARRRAVEGDVLLEVVVLRDGRVGTIRTLRSLDSGLDQRAAEAVRQWRFTPARRHGVPVDVLVEISVAFKLR